MSVKELEAQVQALPPRELKRFANWFDSFRQDTNDELSADQQAELLRRRNEFLANPSLAEPWEGTTERVRRHLHERRAKKAPAR
ncbi:MAG: hypothetical protein ACKODH_08590 [Limisphaerales bacterium]